MAKIAESLGWIIIILVVVVVGANLGYYTYKGIQSTASPGIIVPAVKFQAQQGPTVAGASCIGAVTGKPGVWKFAPNGKLGCWVGP